MSDNGRESLQSVRRALRTLDLIAEAGDMGVTELSRRLGVHKATASRLAATLAATGVIERDATTERYSLGYGLIRLASAATAGMDVLATARPVMEELAERSGPTLPDAAPASPFVSPKRRTGPELGLPCTAPRCGAHGERAQPAHAAPCARA